VSAPARLLEIKVKPGARASLLRQDEAGRWSAQLKALPVDGKANAELVVLIAKHFGCAKSAVSIKSGAGARTKLVKVDVET
jgi:uncharacterized protein (TIGR00251 family)